MADARDAFTQSLASIAGRDDVKETVILWLLALVELRAGNWELAREHAEHTCELSQMLAEGDPEKDPEIEIPLALVSAYQSEDAEARRSRSGGSTRGGFGAAVLRQLVPRRPRVARALGR